MLVLSTIVVSDTQEFTEQGPSPSRARMSRERRDRARVQLQSSCERQGGTLHEMQLCTGRSGRATERRAQGRTPPRAHHCPLGRSDTVTHGYYLAQSRCVSTRRAGESPRRLSRPRRSSFRRDVNDGAGAMPCAEPGPACAIQRPPVQGLSDPVECAAELREHVYRRGRRVAR